MSKIKVGLIYGGASPEHDVSEMTADSVRENINKDKFEIKDIYIDKDGKFDESLLNDIDVAFLATHGPNCEDGRLQQCLEDQGIKYTGSGVDASRINMDKGLMHRTFKEAGLPTVEFEDFDKGEINKAKKFAQNVGFPVFVKPNNAGSSIGVSPVKNLRGLGEAIALALEYDKKITIEKAIVFPREIEVAILGNSDLTISQPGEVLTHGDFYSYENKYFKPFETTVSAALSPEKSEEIRQLAKKAYFSTGCRGYARVDFFLDEDNIYLSEINTLPGFTPVSMYPKMMANIGISYQDLITKIIELALE